MNTLVPPPIESLRDDLIPPEVLPAQSLGGGQRVESLDCGHLRKKFQPQLGRVRRIHSDLAKAGLSRRQDGFLLLVELCREQEELCVLRSKSAASFADAAFTKENDLLPPAQRINNYGPLFESDSHA